MRSRRVFWPPAPAVSTEPKLNPGEAEVVRPNGGHCRGGTVGLTFIARRMRTVRPFVGEVRLVVAEHAYVARGVPVWGRS